MAAKRARGNTAFRSQFACQNLTSVLSPLAIIRAANRTSPARSIRVSGPVSGRLRSIRLLCFDVASSLRMSRLSHHASPA